MRKFDCVEGFTGLYCANNLLFVIYHNREENKVFEITDKENPSALGAFSLPMTDYGRGLAYAYENWFFFIAPYEGFYLLDLGTRNDFEMVKLFPYCPYQFQHLKDNYFVGTGGYGGIYKIDSSYHPEMVGLLDDEIYEFFVHGNYLFGASKDEGLKVFNVVVPEKPELLSQPFGNFLCMSVEHFHAKMVLVKSELGEILNVNIENPQMPRVLSSIEANFLPYKSFFANYPYLTVRIKETDHLLKVFDYSNPTEPQLVFTYPIPSIQHVIHNRSHLAAWGDQYLEILNVNINGEIIKISSYEFSEKIFSVIFIDNYIYVAKSDGIFFFPISKD